MEHAHLLDFNVVRWHLFVNVFGADASQKQAYDVIFDHAQSTVVNDDVTMDLMAKVCAEIQLRAPDLVSFSESIVDQNIWERPANPSVTQQPHGMTLRPAVEVAFFTLVRHFVGHACLTAIFGREFLEHFPWVLEDLLTLDDGWNYLAVGILRWVPLQDLNKACGARKSLLKTIESFNKALDAHAIGTEPECPWRDLSDVSALLKERSAFCRQNNVPSSIEASAVLAFTWR